MIIYKSYQTAKTRYLIYKRKLEERYIVPLSPMQIVFIVTLGSAILGISIRIYYNGFFEYLQNMFVWSWLGFGWGKTPTVVVCAGYIIAIIISMNLFIILNNIQRVHAGMEMIDGRDFIFESVKLIKYKVSEWLYGRSYKWD